MSVTRASLRYVRRPGPLAAVCVVYVLAVSGLMIWRGISVSPDYLLLILVPVALLSGRFLGFLRDWVPFIALFFGYEAIRNILPKTHFVVHYELVIRLDRRLFGGTDPSQWLQAHLGSVHGLAVACTVVYFCHFLLPITVGMVLWLIDRVQFLRFVVAVLGVSFAAFIVFMLVPVAPPWLAGERHLLPGVHSLLALPSSVSPIYNWLDPDATAAFPSLHAAYPLLCALALWRISRRASVLLFAWSGIVWFSVVYLGQHYVTDVLGGIVFALLTWLVVTKVVVPLVPALQYRPPRSDHSETAGQTSSPEAVEAEPLPEAS
jgi:membrane-associated phospholipid phosphatase